MLFYWFIDLFLLLLFLLLLLLLFCFKWHWIRKSQKLYFCNSARQSEKAQDNVSKRSGVEKKLSTLEKDNEVMKDMKRENSDVNVAEQANIWKFSNLDDVATPLRVFISFFDDAVVDRVVGCTKLNGHYSRH